MATGLNLRRKAGPAERRDSAAAGRRRQAPELTLIPQDLRTADPSFFAELSAGTMGLAGATAALNGRSPFRLDPPSPQWQAALLGFGWLSDLRAANSDDADALARQVVDDWLTHEHAPDAPDWTTPVTARRLIAWLCNAGMLTSNASPAAYDRFLLGCQDHIRRLAAAHDDKPGGSDLTARIAVLLGCLCLGGQDRLMPNALAGLKAELARQILPSGGHTSRNPGVAVDLLLDLLPLKQCFMAQGRKPPDWLADAMQRMAAMLRYMQLGDRGLARFNGMGSSEVDRLATVLAYHAGSAPLPEVAAPSGYVRLSRRTTIVIADGGKLPAPPFAGEAHAGTLAFEMSAGGWPLIVNAGAPGPAAQGWRRQARGTAAHSTVLVNDTASSHLENGVLTGPALVEGRLADAGDGAAEFLGLHDGYLSRYGMLHARVLRLAAQGDRLGGNDRIFQGPKGPSGRMRNDLTYSIHFHIHPQARARYGEEPGMALITLPGGEIWTFKAYGSKLSLEDSLFFASFTGPTRTVQLVLRGHVLADTQIAWSLERGAPPPKPRLG